MANPSAFPASSAGTEILRRSYINDHDGTTGAHLINGVANYTYTVLSIVFCDVNDTSELISMWIDYEGTDSGVAGCYLLHDFALTNKQTFVWNDKIFLSETDELLVKTDSASAIDVYCTYIEQRWA